MATMDATSATKRKEPEASTEPEQTKEEATKEAVTTKEEATKENVTKEDAAATKEPETATKEPEVKEPEAKKLKPSPPDAAAVRKQVEYYLSDENLRGDKFFNEKIASNEEGWLEMSLILSCNKMKAMRANLDDVIAALKDSKLELKEGGSAVRRPGNAPLPKLEEKPMHHNKKNTLHAHDGGAVLVVRNVPAEQSWMQVKEKVKEKLPEKVTPWHVSEVNDKAQCFVVCPPFSGDLELFQNLSIEIGGATLRTEPCYGELLQQSLKMLPKHVRDKREREQRRRQKERNRPILIGEQKFLSVGFLRGKVKEIMNSRSDGEKLKPEGTDYKLLKALLAFHPKGEEKMKGMVGMKVDKATKGDGQSRCFHIIREDNSVEDVSMVKCINAVEQNPPYVAVEKKAEKKPDDKKPAAVQQAEAVKTEESKASADDKAEAVAAKTEDTAAAKVEDKIQEGKTPEKMVDVQAKAEETPEAPVASADDKTAATSQ